MDQESRIQLESQDCIQELESELGKELVME